jgi:hypothetical protein
LFVYRSPSVTACYEEDEPKISKFACDYDTPSLELDFFKMLNDLLVIDCSVLAETGGCILLLELVDFFLSSLSGAANDII